MTVAKERETLPARMIREIEEDFWGEDDSDRVEAASDYVELIKQILVDVANRRCRDRKLLMRIHAIIKWFPRNHLEDYLILMFDYAADEILGKAGKKRQRKS